MVSCLLALVPIPHGVRDSTLYPVTVFSLTESLIMHSCWILTVGLATWFVLAYASSQASSISHLFSYTPAIARGKQIQSSQLS